jgi:class 3 adenylate cyclase
MLDFRWQLLCPQCRVSRSSSPTLSAIRPQVHCETCKINYTVDFDRSVELTFRPNPSIRDLDESIEFCIAGPQVTPHVEVQQLLPPYASRLVEPSLELGEYRLRLLETNAEQEVRVTPSGERSVAIKTNPSRSLSTASEISPNPALDIENDTASERLFILERLAWSDQTVTAAEVTSMQVFRDLFANEALRPGERISVGSLTVAFTDLKQSTRMYREIGDAPAFGQVLDHFAVLRKSIEEKDGAIVKTMGDSVLAVFKSPADAVETLSAAQHALGNPPEGMRPLHLKIGIHSGPCIAVTLNERLDYFGTTLNVASRLVELSDGSDMVISRIVRDDAEVGNLIRKDGLRLQPMQAPLKGLEDQPIELWRVIRPPQTPPFR